MTLSTYELLKRVESRVIALTQIMVADMANTQQALNDLRAKVEKQTTVLDGLLVYNKGLADQLRDAKNDPEEVAAIADAIESNTNRMAAATVSGTAAEDEEPAPDAPNEPSEPAP